MTAITTDYLRRTYGKKSGNEARGALNYLRSYTEDPVADTCTVNYAKRTSSAIGVAEFEAGGDAYRLRCDCGQDDCNHAIGVLWHRALTREGMTKEEWWEAEKHRRIIDEEKDRAEEQAIREAEAARWQQEHQREIERRQAEAKRRAAEVEIEKNIGKIFNMPTSSTIDGFSFRLDFSKMIMTPLYNDLPFSAYHQNGYGRGGYGGARYGGNVNQAQARYESSANPTIAQIATLAKALPVASADARSLKGPVAKIIIDLLVSQGVATDIDGYLVIRGATQRIEGSWETDDKGVQRYKITTELPDNMRLYDLGGQILAYNGDTAEVSNVDAGMPDATLLALIRTVVEPETSAIAQQAIRKHIGDNHLPAAIKIERRRRRPISRVKLDEVGSGTARRQRTKISMEYDWGRFAPGSTQAQAEAEGARSMEDGKLIINERDYEAERELMANIPDETIGKGERADEADGVSITFDAGEMASLAFRRDILPLLDQSEDHVVERTVSWSSDLIQWLDGDDDINVEEGASGALHVSIAPGLEGMDRDILPSLVEMVKTVAPETDPTLVAGMFDAMLERPVHPVRRRSDGVMLVPHAILLRLLPAIWHLVHAGGMDETGGMSRIGGVDLTSIGTDVTLRLPDRLKRLLALLEAAGKKRRITIPKSFNPAETVDQAQLEGLRWMTILHEAGYGGILADEVGVGKTLQLLLHIARRKERDDLPDGALVVVTKTSLEKWEGEVNRFFPGMDVHVWHGGGRRAERARVDETTIVLTTPYEIVNDPEINQRRWSLVAIDEAQDARNPRTMLAEALRNIEADQKIPTSGTPIENSLLDAWSLMEIACPGLLGTQGEFKEHVIGPIERQEDPAKRLQFKRFLQPFVLSRTRDEAGHGVPPPENIDHHIKVGDDQARLYETVRLSAHSEFSQALREGGVKWRRCVLPIILRLRQACCHPALIKAEFVKSLVEGCPSAKTFDIVATALECKREGRRMLVFSSWTGHLNIIKDELERHGVTCGIIHGGVPLAQRSKILKRYRETGDLDALLITTKTGGRAIDVPEADDVFIVDPWWNPQPEVQAIGRTQRRGQKKVVRVHRFIIQDSIETKIMKIQVHKVGLSSIIRRDDQKMSAKLTIEDMNDILMPLGRGH